MRYKVVFVSGLAIGFVLGAKAGRERYEKLMKLARKAAENPGVQQAAAALRSQALGAAKAAGGKLSDRAGSARAKFGETLHERVPGMRNRDSNGKARGRGHGYAEAPGNPGDAQRE